MFRLCRPIAIGFLAATLMAARGQTAPSVQDPEALIRAVRANPNSAKLTGELVVALANNGHLEDAYRLAQTFYEKHPHDLDAEKLYLRVLVATNQANALAMARKLLAANPHDGELLFLNGAQELKAGEFTVARGHLEQSVAITPDFAESRYNLGITLAKLQDMAGAREQLEKAIALGAHEPEVYRELSKALRALGETQAADDQLKLYQQAMKANTDREMAASKSADAAQALGSGDATKAAGLYREALEVTPQDAALASQLAIALDRAGDTAGERMALEQAVALDPKQAPAQYQLGYLLFQGGEFDAAELHFRTALSDDPKFTQAWISLAATLASKSKYSEAQEAITHALHLEPRNAQALAMKRQLLAAQTAH